MPVPAYRPQQGFDETEVRSTLDELAREDASACLVRALEYEGEEVLGWACHEPRPGQRRGYRSGVEQGSKIAVGCGSRCAYHASAPPGNRSIRRRCRA